MRTFHETSKSQFGTTHLEELIDRLERGEQMIHQLQAEDKPIEHLETHWIELLHEYETEYRALESAA